jgi:hypothetical protein
MLTLDIFYRCSMFLENFFRGQRLKSPYQVSLGDDMALDHLYQVDKAIFLGDFLEYKDGESGFALIRGHELKRIRKRIKYH